MKKNAFLFPIIRRSAASILYFLRPSLPSHPLKAWPLLRIRCRREACIVSENHSPLVQALSGKGLFRRFYLRESAQIPALFALAERSSDFSLDSNRLESVRSGQSVFHPYARASPASTRASWRACPSALRRIA